MVATFIGEIACDPMAFRECCVDCGEDCGKLIEATDFKPADGVVKEKRSVVLSVANRAAFKENRPCFIGNQPASIDDRSCFRIHGLTTREHNKRREATLVRL